MNGGGGLNSAELSAGAGVLGGRRTVLLDQAPAGGDVLTLPDTERESVAQLGVQPGRQPGAFAGPRSVHAVESALSPESAAPLASAPPLEPGPPLSGRQVLLGLARQFAEADAEQAHDLFASAFGLYGARHFGLAPDAASADLAHVSWWHGPTVRQPADPALPGGLPRARRARPRAVEAAAVRPSVERANVGRHRKREALVGGAEQSATALAAERRAAARLLLAHPLVTATGPHGAAFPLIRRHADWLTTRFDELLGYPLTVTEHVARLRKSGLGPGSLRGLDLDGTPCPPTVYAALALALAVLTAGPHRWPQGQLAAALEAAAEEAGVALADRAGEGVASLLPVTLATATAPATPTAPAAPAIPTTPATPVVGRAAAVAALSVLARWQVLAEPEAAAAGWLTVDQDVLAALVGGLGRAGARGYVPLDGAAADVPLAMRRRLVETPVVLLDELSALECEWLRESCRREAGVLADFLGLTAELRSEGIALLDPAGELTDLRLPGADGVARTALLLVERLVEQLRPLPLPTEAPGAACGAPVPGVQIPEALIDGILGDVADEYGAATGWSRVQLADRAAFRREVLRLLEQMRLIAPADSALGAARALRGADEVRGRSTGGWLLLAPAARYAAQAELRPARGKGRHSRRGEEADQGSECG